LEEDVQGNNQVFFSGMSTAHTCTLWAACGVFLNVNVGGIESYEGALLG